MKDSLLLIVLGIIASILVSVCAGPSSPKWQSSQVVEAFKSAGLEAESARPMTKAEDGMALMVTVEGTRFLIPSLGEAKDGRIRSFDNPEDLEKTRAYAVRLGEENAAFFSWVFVKDNILVQINGNLPEEQARKYEAALNGMK